MARGYRGTSIPYNRSVQPATRWKILGAFALVPGLFSLSFLWPALSGRFVPSFRDQSDFFLPSHLYTATRLAHRQIPLWNWMAGNGETWIGNGQNEIFYPPALLFLVRNAGIAAGAFLLLHFILGGAFACGFLRERGATRPAALAGAAVFTVSGMAISLSAYWNHFSGMIWIPALAWTAERGLRTRKQRAAFGASAGLAFLAGSPEAALLGSLAAALVFAAGRRRDAVRREEEWSHPVRRWSSFAGALAAGIALGAVEIVPLADTAWRAARRSSGAAAVPVRQLASLVRSPSGSALGWLPADASWVQTLYLSLPIIGLAAAAFFLWPRSRERALWGAVAVAGIAVSLFSTSVPFRYPAKVLMLTLLAVAVLVSEGVDGLRFESPGRAAWAAIVFTAGVAGAFLAGPSRIEKGMLAAAGALLALSAFGTPDFRGLTAALGAVFLAGHLALAASPLIRFARTESFARKPRATRAKVLTSPDDLLSEWATSVLPDEDARVRRQIDSLEGYSNMRFGIPKATTGSALPSQESSAFMARLAGRTDFLVPAIVSGSKEIRFPSGARLAQVVVADTLAGVAFFSDAEVERDWERALARATAPSFDPLHRLLVGTRLSDAPTRRNGTRGRAAIGSVVSETPERVELRVSVSEPLWMYRPQSWDPWWAAWVDGRRTPIVRANGVFSAIVVPQGEHRVVFAYRPLPFYVGGGVSAIGLSVLLIWSLAGEPIVRTRRT